MKPTLIAPMLAACLLAMLAGSPLAETQKLVVPLTNPGKPATLEASLIHGSIEVEGYDGSEIQIEIVYDAGDGKPEKVGGLTRIPSNSMGLTIEEDDNVISVDADWTSQDIDLKLRVPVRTSLHLDCVNGRDIVVTGVHGRHELNHVNGAISAIDVQGSVVANTTNGHITVKLAKIDKGVPMSFTTFNGNVDVTLPKSLKSNLRLKVGQGDIYTDFELKLSPVEPEITKEKGKGGYRLRMEREVRGTVGGGGEEFYFKTYQGSIYLRKLP